MEAVRREADAWLRRLADREPTAVAVTAGTAVVLAVGLLVAFSRSSSSGASGGGDSDVPTKAGRGAGGAVEVDAVVTPVRPKRTSAAAAGGAGAPAAVVAITPATEETVAAAAASATAADVLPKPLLLAFLRELIENLQQFKVRVPLCGWRRHTQSHTHTTDAPLTNCRMRWPPACLQTSHRSQRRLRASRMATSRA